MVPGDRRSTTVAPPKAYEIHRCRFAPHCFHRLTADFPAVPLHLPDRRNFARTACSGPHFRKASDRLSRCAAAGAVGKLIRFGRGRVKPVRDTASTTAVAKAVSPKPIAPRPSPRPARPFAHADGFL